jgi:predicted nucleic acid-binding protein
MGITVLKIIDSILATRCIESDLTLLHSDRDFLSFVEHLGLKVAYSET